MLLVFFSIYGGELRITRSWTDSWRSCTHRQPCFAYPSHPVNSPCGDAARRKKLAASTARQPASWLLLSCSGPRLRVFTENKTTGACQQTRPDQHTEFEFDGLVTTRISGKHRLNRVVVWNSICLFVGRLGWFQINLHIVDHASERVGGLAPPDD